MAGEGRRGRAMSSVPSLRAQFTVREIDATGIVDIPARELLKLAGIDPDRVDDPAATVPLRQLAAVYELAAERSGDAAFGLHVGEHARTLAQDIFDYALLSRPTIAQGFEALKPLLAAVYPEAETKLFVRDSVAGFSYRMDPREARMQRHRCEALITGVTKLAARALGRDDPPISVSFQHGRPADVSEHARILRAPCYFDCPVAEILFPSALLEAPVVTADPNLSAVLDRHVHDLLTRLPTSSRFSDQVRRALVEAFRARPPTLAGLAKRLGVSERTLQRRLHEEGTSLQALTEDVRHELSLEYLRDPSLSVGEVGGRLGYSSLAAFSRAFRRWRGVSPAAHRRANLRSSLRGATR
jgi:AraC-like DNA-binding protein